MSKELKQQLTEVFDDLMWVEVLRRKEKPESRLTLCRIRANKLEGTDNLRGMAVVLDADSLDLPRFQMTPETKLGSRIPMLSGGDIDFDDSSQFSDSYFLHGMAEEAIRVLFTRELRERLGERPGWSVRGQGRVLVIYRLRGAHKLEGPDLELFTKEALKLCSLFRAGEHQLDLQPEVSREGHPDEMIAMGDRTGFGMGNAMRKAIERLRVTPSEMDEFVAQSPPRNIPQGIANQVLGKKRVWFGFGFPILLFALLIIATNHEKPEDFGVSAVIASIGLFLVGFPIVRRKLKRDVLENGILTTGEILQSRRTNVATNGRQDYRIDLAYDVDGQEQYGKMIGYREQSERARRFQHSEKNVRVLYDAGKPGRFICLDLLEVFD